MKDSAHQKDGTTSGDVGYMRPTRPLGTGAYQNAAEPYVIPHERYSVGVERARGGLGRIIEAHDKQLDRTVALKELLANGGEAEARFAREALITARLQHPAIVPIYEAGRWANGKPYYAMKLVSGRSLDKVIEEKTTLNERLALLPNIIAIADAVAYAHEQKVIHRDLKPSNVMIGPFGETIVIDWGLATDLTKTNVTRAESPSPYEAATSGLTVVGTIMGTPEYMPAEQAEGKQVDERADVYAIGAILYHVLTGASPYVGRSADAVLERVIKQKLVPVNKHEPDVPGELATIVHKAMARNPADRYSTAKELAEDLKRFQTGQLVIAHKYSTFNLALRWMRQNRVPVAITGIALLVLTVLGAMSIRRIVREKDRAEAQRELAEKRSNELVLVQAKSWLDHDPTKSIAWLKTYPAEGKDWEEVHDVAADAQSRGLSRHVIINDTPYVTFSPDGRTIATGVRGAGIRIRNVATGAILTSLPHPNPIFAMKFSLDGSSLLFLERDKPVVLVWNIQDNKLRSFSGDGGAIFDAEFSPLGGTIAAVGMEQSINLWSLSTGQRRQLHGHTGIVQIVRFSPDGKVLATSGNDGTIRVWDPIEGQQKNVLTHKGDIRALTFSHDGTRIALGGMEANITVWDLGDNTTRLFVGHTKNIWKLSFSPDDKTLASCGEDATIRIWNLASSESTVLQGHTEAVYSLAFSPDGQLLSSAGQDGILRLWGVRNGQLLRQLRGHQAPIFRVVISSDGKWVASTGADMRIRLWSLPGDLGEIRPGHASLVSQLAFSRDGTLLASGALDNTVRVSDLRQRGDRVFHGHQGLISKIMFSRDNKTLISTSHDKTVRLWNLVDGSSTVMRGHENVVVDAVMSADGSVVASAGADGVICTWDLRGTGIRCLRGHTAGVRSIAFSPVTNLLVSAGSDRTLRIWSTETGSDRILENSNSFLANQVVFSPDGKLIISGNDDGTIRLWDVDSGVARILDGHHAAILGVAISSDGEVIASGSKDTTVHLWNLRTGKDVVLKGHRFPVLAVSMSPNGKFVMSGAPDDAIRWWDAATGVLLAVYRIGGDRASPVFSPDGQYFALSGMSHTVQVMRLPTFQYIPNSSRFLKSWLDNLSTAILGHDEDLYSFEQEAVGRIK